MIAYITGAPAVGKSTLCSRLTQLPGVEHFAYSAKLRDHLNARLSLSLSESDIRASSARLVTPEDVASVDHALKRDVARIRERGGHLLIDSHPVTKEDYGFRVTPFSTADLADLEIDRFLCLYASPDVLERRIRADPKGRPLPSAFELATHVQLQAAVVAQYAVLTGKHCYLIDADVDRDVLAQNVAARLQLMPG